MDKEEQPKKLHQLILIVVEQVCLAQDTRVWNVTPAMRGDISHGLMDGIKYTFVNLSKYYENSKSGDGCFYCKATYNRVVTFRLTGRSGSSTKYWDAAIELCQRCYDNHINNRVTTLNWTLIRLLSINVFTEIDACSSCSSLGTVSENCVHGKYSAHEYCSHGKIVSHTL